MKGLLRQWGQYFVKHTRVTALVAFFATLLPVVGVPMAWIASILIALITLCVSWQAGAYIMFWSLLPSAALLWTAHWFSGTTILVLMLVSWLLASVLRATKSWTLVIETGACVGIVIILLMHTLFDVSAWWQLRLQFLLGEVAQLTHIEVKHVASVIARFATGLELLFVLLSVLLHILLARLWQSVILKHRLRLLHDLLSIRLGVIELGVLAVSLLLAWMGVGVVIDLLPLILLTFALTGLSVTHAVLRLKQLNKAFFIAFYLLLVLFFPYMLLLLACIGALDCGIHFRKRYNVP